MKRNLAAFGITSIVLGAACGSQPQIEFKNNPPDAGMGGVENSGSGGSHAGTGGSIVIVGQDSGAKPEASTSDGSTVDAVCGDGVLVTTGGEGCDDGNTDPGDGCDKACQVENGWYCPYPGHPCKPAQTCGDSNISGSEKCDDGNTDDDDGCSADCTTVEEGWTCPGPGARCQAAECGDGIVVGSEQCDDHNDKSGDGCSSKCRIEDGYFCPTAGAECKKTTCGDGKREGDEPCDDGNLRSGDGCSSKCQLEPTCAEGECHSVCGDGMTLSGDNEECDDGNTNDKDGCTHDCKKEKGWDCKTAAEAAPSELVLPVVYRDFIALTVTASGGGDAGTGDAGKADAGRADAAGDAGGAPLKPRHPNFEDNIQAALSPGLVKAQLGTDGKPAFAGICGTGTTGVTTDCPAGRQLTTEADFDQWYRDVSGVNVRADSTITLSKSGSQYVFDAGSRFLPFGAAGDLADVGWVAQGFERSYVEGGKTIGNFGFTTELHYWFQFAGGEHLEFSGDDDVWVFLKNALIMDLGGRHAKLTRSVDLTDAGLATLGLTLEKGHIYEIAFFHAERHTVESNFKLTLNNFVRSSTACTSICGDGIVVAGEVCDDGDKNGTYNHCNKDCTGLGPHCGDNEVQASDGEECDDGVNLTTYGMNGKSGCAPGCKWSPYCGDGKTDSLFGEQCDSAGVKTSDGCQLNCTFNPRCGDGIVQPALGESCDDNNTVSGDGCSMFCTVEPA